jgi:hypothetical protein
MGTSPNRGLISQSIADVTLDNGLGQRRVNERTLNPREEPQLDRHPLIHQALGAEFRKREPELEDRTAQVMGFGSFERVDGSVRRTASAFAIA